MPNRDVQVLGSCWPRVLMGGPELTPVAHEKLRLNNSLRCAVCNAGRSWDPVWGQG